MNEDSMVFLLGKSLIFGALMVGGEVECVNTDRKQEDRGTQQELKEFFLGYLA